MPSFVPVRPSPPASSAHLWDVHDPSTALFQCVKARDAAQAADIAWTRWYGSPPMSALDLLFYTDLGVSYLGPAGASTPGTV